MGVQLNQFNQICQHMFEYLINIHQRSAAQTARV